MANYPWWLAYRLASRIENGQADAARQDFVQILAGFDREHGPALGPRKLRCASLMSWCLRGAHRGGADSETILQQFMVGLEELTATRSWKGICAFMRRYLDDLLGEVRPQQSGDVERLVRTIRRELERSPDRALPIKRYAYNAGINADYLSRRFAELAGESFRDLRRQAQMDRARDLLTQTSLKISAIARQVGIEDCSRFIRNFKQWSGATPAVYRKMHRT